MTMENQATFKDRTDWGPGPWDGEPDRVEWRTRGFVALAKRGPHGAWCGYLGVPEGHPWHGLAMHASALRRADDAAHGGLSFAAACEPHDGEVEPDMICHVPRPGEPDTVWWLGFDCHHCNDLGPGAAARDRAFGARLRAEGDLKGAELFESPLLEGENYWPITYVRERIEAMAEAAERAHA
jgi:hypothetical protein